MMFPLLMGDVAPPPPPVLTERILLPQPETVWLAGIALAAAAFLTLYGLLRRRGRRGALLAGVLVAACILGLAAYAAQRSAQEWRYWQEQRHGWTAPLRDIEPPPWSDAPGVAPPP